MFPYCDFAIGVFTLIVTIVFRIVPLSFFTCGYRGHREAPNKTVRDKLQIAYGINYKKHCMLWGTFLWQERMASADNYLIDAVHTTSCNGVGGTEIAEVVQALNSKCTHRIRGPVSVARWPGVGCTVKPMIVQLCSASMIVKQMFVFNNVGGPIYKANACFFNEFGGPIYKTNMV